MRISNNDRDIQVHLQNQQICDQIYGKGSNNAMGRYALNLTSIQKCTAHAKKIESLHKRIPILIRNEMDIEETVRMDTILI